MDSTDLKDLIDMGTDRLTDYRKALAELFSGYRAEWLDEKLFDLFTEPSYFPQLTTSHPCFLEGGRGTGKTTVLRCLSYQGQAALRRAQYRDVPEEWPYVGLYYRVNTNRVRAFAGPELELLDWTRMFAHYINIEFCEAVVGFLIWHTQQNPKMPAISTAGLSRVAATLHLNAPSTLDELRDGLLLSKLKFEAAVNNIADRSSLPLLSVQGGAIDVLLREVKGLSQFQHSFFFFLIDEYENFDKPQQRVLNTLIKHCGEFYSFKVGVRELGFRERSTLNAQEQLTHPADYRLINISQELEGRFSDFAAEVCQQRLQRVIGADEPSLDLTALLPALSAEEEAAKLGVGDAVGSVVEELRGEALDNEGFRRWLSDADLLEVFALVSRARQDEMTNSEKLREILRDPQRWNRHYENYKYAYLFSIRQGKRGIRKYFAGWRVLCLLAASNIRYLLELVDQALNKHFNEGLGPLDPVTHEIQTVVAQNTGQRNLRELEGISLNGGKLSRLLLGLGRIFQVMAEDPTGHTPEVNQFQLNADIENEECRGRVAELVTDGVMNLALLRYPGSKLQQQTDIRQFDYAVHPIFAAFFGFSHRRKRKIELSDQDILALIDRPKETIGDVLSRQNRSDDMVLDELPEQMQLFRGFYATVE